MWRVPLAALFVACFAMFGSPEETPIRSDALLAMGIAQVRDGDFEAAVFTLDRLVRRWENDGSLHPNLPRAYLFFGAAYVGLEHESAARGKFQKALKHDPNLRFSPEEVPPKVIEIFESERLKTAAGTSRHLRKVALIAGGATAVTALTVGVVAGIATANGDPTVRIAVRMGTDWMAIAGVTQVTFTAMATDDERDPMTYAWDFGDGETATGRTVVHVYPSAGTFTASVIVEDGRGGVERSSIPVYVGALSGRWESDGDGFNCTQSATTFHCEVQVLTKNILAWDLVLADPHRVATGTLLLRDQRSLRCNGGEVGTGLTRVICFVDDPSRISPVLAR